ncbi:SDR family oxidoreductase [Alicyclobacillus dauci]|uniref:SDR family oxidoreductase n=1 Tax=Alicyclobacillus dauci TaxID=1475485 RepID=A0ABY6Z0N9_9BACL|nr:SDR family oxidoreductase [Alicyclobacillus dauci]WAH36424.1 SDR family oxidoreductase [Alicyclobacillus dauci]
MILVTGATGNVGRELVKQLHQAGQHVRVLTRNPEKASFPTDVEIAVGDLASPVTLKDALNGVQQVFFVRVPGSDAFPRIAKESGVDQIVFLSSGAIDSPTENAIGRNHLHTEELIRQSGMKWTFLRPGAFMSNSLHWAQSIRTENVVRAPFGDVGTAPIDQRDIASVAANVLVSSGHDGKVYSLTGPEILTPVQQVEILGSVLGRDIRFENVPESVAAESMKRFAPPEIVDAIFALIRDNRNHVDSVTTTVEDVTDRRAHTFRQWATDYSDLFR